jgi:hypothetical protein
MGKVKVDLGFDRASGRVTVDGKPHGAPIGAALLANALAPRRETWRERLMGGTAKRAHIWAQMPKPDAE